ncbi:NUDIX domain-containing protein [Thermodesulfitimonas sp.]
MLCREKTLYSEYPFRGKILNVRVDRVLLPDGRISTREVVEHSGAVAIVPLTETLEVVMVRQYRHPVGRELLEIPAGKIEAGEEPEACARRELAEEVGLKARRLELIGRFYPTPGFANELTHLYLARDLIPGTAAPDDGEFLEIVRLPFTEALAMALRGEICDAKTICGLLLTSRMLEGVGKG